MKDTVCATVVTFNRKDLLVKCIGSLLGQTLKPQAIYIVDNNSTDNTQGLLKECGYVEEVLPDSNAIESTQTVFGGVLIKYIRLPSNMGGAGGFYYGVKEAYHDNYDWVWIMDDDAFPTETCLEELQPYYHSDGAAALASLKVDLNGNVLYHHRGYFNFKHGLPVQRHITKEDTQGEVHDIDMASFVGLLVNKDAIAKAGFPKKEFFIHADDLEYCIRLRAVGKIKLINNSIIMHAEGSAAGTFKKGFLGIGVDRRPYGKLWINYYMQRNLIWIGCKYSENKLSLYLAIIKNYLLTLVGIIIFDDNKYKRMKFYTNAYIDGFKSNFDNEKPKKILYN